MARRLDSSELIDVRQAARLIGRHPETVRRWVWSGRLVAERRGKRLLVDRFDVEAIARHHGSSVSLTDWSRRAAALRAAVTRGATAGGRRESAAELVLADRLRDSEAGASDARR